MKFALKLPKIELSPLKQVWFVVAEIGKLLWLTDKNTFFWMVMFNVLTSSVILPVLYLDKLFIDTILISIGNTNWQAGFRTILLIVSLRFLLATLKGISSRGVGYTNDSLSRKFNQKIDELLAKQHSVIDVSTIEDAKFKDRFAKIEREGGNRAWQIVSSFADIPRTVSGIISSLAIFIFFKPIIALLSVLFIVPSLIVDAVFTKRGYRIEDSLKTKYRIWGMLTYYLIRAKSYLELRLLGVSDFLISKMTGIQSEILSQKQKMRKDRVIAGTIVSVPEDIFFFGLDAYFALLAIWQQITVGSAQAYVRAIATFKENLSDLAGSFIQFYENYLYVSDLVWFLKLKPDRNIYSGNNFPKEIKKGIVFDNVWFKYPESSEWILKGVNFSIDPTENAALVGENGAGKTTLVKLLCGFYVPTKGKILIDGKAVDRYALSKYWKSLAVLFQDFEDYDFSARESIGYGNISKINSLPTIRKYAKLANINEWIESLPLKYNTPLSRWYDKGVSPSGGQRQRIGIARTLIKDAQIIILDEPTSNVDPQAEEDIFNHVLKLGKEKILIFISHRFSTVRRADKILVLDKGTVAEQGSHEELMKLDSKYAKLFTLQAKSYQ